MSSTTLPQSNPSGSISYSSSATDATAQPDLPASSTNGKRGSISAINPDSVHPAANQTDVISPSTQSKPLNAHHRPSVDANTVSMAKEGHRGSVDSQGNPVTGLAGDTTIRRTSLSQNAPGKAGDIGENAIGALGFGGASVERPLKDQGLGEKIVNFLGS